MVIVWHWTHAAYAHMHEVDEMDSMILQNLDSLQVEQTLCVPVHSSDQGPAAGSRMSGPTPVRAAVE